jgi:hypothetical protein
MLIAYSSETGRSRQGFAISLYFYSRRWPSALEIGSGHRHTGPVPQLVGGQNTGRVVTRSNSCSPRAQISPCLPEDRRSAPKITTLKRKCTLTLHRRPAVPGNRVYCRRSPHQGRCI